MDIRNLTAAQIRDRAIAQSQQRLPQAQTTTSSEPSQDDVALSATAQSVRLFAEDTRVPFDQNRVDAIRAAIAEGRYHIDPDRLARNFMQIEYDIFQ
ncbi:MAG: flagellar biosynthesis anti-sigma factor FlgM [Pseudomonadales bacterium]|nr:flagellar biosynthesis anti-sigma factor FlgM [Pseudomonadales bacterium]MCP5184720.1 flagellar biosynthesis anti-sigma factor FlgM [Pseudomonadales bacterium]